MSIANTVIDDLGRLGMSTDPFDLFSQWLVTVEESPLIPQSNVMMLSTAAPTQTLNEKDTSFGNIQPSMRLLQMLDFSRDGLDFVTSSSSLKVKEINLNPHVCIAFNWLALGKFVSIQGKVIQLDKEMGAQLFRKYIPPIQAAFCACGDTQSKPIASMTDICARMQDLNKVEPSQLSVPDYIAGYRVVISRMEFFQAHPTVAFLADRFIFTKVNQDKDNSMIDELKHCVTLSNGKWIIERIGA